MRPITGARSLGLQPARARGRSGHRRLGAVASRRTCRESAAAASRARAARRCPPRARTGRGARRRWFSSWIALRKTRPGEGVVGALPGAAVGEVEADPLRGCAAPSLAGWSQWRRMSSGTLETGLVAADLAARAHEAVDAVAEAAVRRRVAEEGVVGHVRGPVARAAERARKERPTWSSGSQPGAAIRPRPVVPAAEGELAAAAEDRVAGGDGRHRLREDVGEAEAAARERGHVGGADPVLVDGVGAQRVDDHEQDVGAVGPLREARSAASALGSSAAVARPRPRPERSDAV